jgi:hypothetical protein
MSKITQRLWELINLMEAGVKQTIMSLYEQSFVYRNFVP